MIIDIYLYLFTFSLQATSILGPRFGNSAVPGPVREFGYPAQSLCPRGVILTETQH